MEVVFPKFSCLGNDIHSLLWKLGSLYLFIVATNLFQVIAGSLWKAIYLQFQILTILTYFVQKVFSFQDLIDT